MAMWSLHLATEHPSGLPVVQILVKTNCFVFFWLASRKCLVILVEHVHYRSLNHAAHHLSCKLSFHKDKIEKRLCCKENARLQIPRVKGEKKNKGQGDQNHI